jgi:hypothetical protein
MGEPRVLRASRRFGWGRALWRLVDEIDALGRGEEQPSEAAPARPRWFGVRLRQVET